MPINYKKYPPNWKTEIRPRILERAGNCCEFCNVPNYAVGHRTEDGEFVPAAGSIHHDKAGRGKLSYTEAREIAVYENDVMDYKTIVIVLTIAHLDHDSSNLKVKDERLKALCQKCHLSYDAEYKAKKRKDAKNNS